MEVNALAQLHIHVGKVVRECERLCEQVLSDVGANWLEERLDNRERFCSATEVTGVESAPVALAVANCPDEFAAVLLTRRRGLVCRHGSGSRCEHRSSRYNDLYLYFPGDFARHLNLYSSLHLHFNLSGDLDLHFSLYFDGDLNRFLNFHLHLTGDLDDLGFGLRARY